jgi:hypothetical protein
MPKKFTQEDFINKVKTVHGDKYDYSLVKYSNSYGKVDIICKTHGVFSINANSLIQGINCKKCHFENTRLIQEDFINKCKLKHPNKYDYSETIYVNRRTSFNIKCLKHDTIFNSNYNSILNYNDACPTCQKEQKIGINIKTKEHFIERAKKVHGDKYDYTYSDYRGQKIKLNIYCKKCDKIFIQNPIVHVNDKCGCPTCNLTLSKGENNTEKLLKECGFEYIKQHKFPDCKYKKPLSFDFYLPIENLCIEYDGEQHFKPIKHFGGEESFIETQIRDNIKTNYCKENNIHLIRIRYDENIIEKIEQFFTPNNTIY